MLHGCGITPCSYKIVPYFSINEDFEYTQYWQIVVEAGRSFTMAAEEEASRLSTECSRQVSY